MIANREPGLIRVYSRTKFGIWNGQRSGLKVFCSLHCKHSFKRSTHFTASRLYIKSYSKTQKQDHLIPKSICLRFYMSVRCESFTFVTVIFSICFFLRCICILVYLRGGTNQQFHESRWQRIIKKHYRDYAASAFRYTPTVSILVRTQR